MSTITQIISTAPAAPSRQDPTTFADKSDAFVGYIESMDTELNTWTGQVNTVAGEVNTNAGIATTQAGLATTNGAAQVALAAAQVTLAAEQAGLAIAAKEDAEAAAQSVASLTEGSINDFITNTTNTYSSQKISTDYQPILTPDGQLSRQMLIDFGYTFLDKGN